MREAAPALPLYDVTARKVHQWAMVGLVALGFLLGPPEALALAGRGARWVAGARVGGARALPSRELWDPVAAAPDGRPAVVAFSTPSCAACHTAQKPALASLQSRAEGAVRVLEIDAASRP